MRGDLRRGGERRGEAETEGRKTKEAATWAPFRKMFPWCVQAAVLAPWAVFISWWVVMAAVYLVVFSFGAEKKITRRS